MSELSTEQKFFKAAAMIAAADALKKKALTQLEEATQQNVRAFQMEADAEALREEAANELEYFGLAENDDE